MILSYKDHGLSSSTNGAEIFFETFFTLNIIISFFVEFEVDGKTQPERDLEKIAEHYLKGDFLHNFIPVLPL